MMKNGQSPKIPCLLQFVAEIWALLGPIISMQILRILHQVLQFRPSPKLESVIDQQQPRFQLDFIVCDNMADSHARTAFSERTMGKSLYTKACWVTRFPLQTEP